MAVKEQLVWAMVVHMGVLGAMLVPVQDQVNNRGKEKC